MLDSYVYANYSLMTMQMARQGTGKRRKKGGKKKGRGMDGWKRLRCQRTQRWME